MNKNYFFIGFPWNIAWRTTYLLICLSILDNYYHKDSFRNLQNSNSLDKKILSERSILLSLKGLNCDRGASVECGSDIVLTHINTMKNLHSHNFRYTLQFLFCLELRVSSKWTASVGATEF